MALLNRRFDWLDQVELLPEYLKKKRRLSLTAVLQKNAQLKRTLVNLSGVTGPSNWFYWFGKKKNN